MYKIKIFFHPMIDNKEKTKEANPRYNEKIATKEYLISQKGIPFLLKTSTEMKFSKNKEIDDIDYLIDFYCTWTNSFPSRKSLKMSKYDYLKYVEEFCMKKENSQFCEFLFE